MRISICNEKPSNHIKIACEKEYNGDRYVLTEDFKHVKDYFSYNLNYKKKYIVFKRYLL